MYRIRMHGRGGQGMKTAGRILGSAFFAEGFEVQDAPRYGAERRGAPIFATVRAAREPIRERGDIAQPDLVVVADETLIPIAAAGVLAGVDERTVVLLRSATGAEVWRQRLKLSGPLLVLQAALEETAELRFEGAACAGAAARLVGVVSRASLERALRSELAELGESLIARNLAAALTAYDGLEEHAGCVGQGPDPSPASAPRPEWIELPFEEVRVSAPDIHGAATSVQVRTGLWRTMRPVVDLEHCNRCHWICSSFCPDGAIAAGPDGAPRIDYDHCKGCLVCVAVCPRHAIRAVPEARAREEETA
jgi:pyruvate ferredoxin oxidoreductase gamma subunit